MSTTSTGGSASYTCHYWTSGTANISTSQFTTVYDSAIYSDATWVTTKDSAGRHQSAPYSDDARPFWSVLGSDGRVLVVNGHWSVFTEESAARAFAEAHAKDGATSVVGVRAMYGMAGVL